MKFRSSCKVAEQWRWLHQLDFSSPEIWQLLALVKRAQYRFKNQAMVCSGSIDLEQAFLNDSNTFVTLFPSLLLKTSQLENIFIIEEDESARKGSLEFDFKTRASSLSFHNCSAEVLNHLTNLFGWEFKPETAALKQRRQLTPLPVCSCCAHAIKTRRLEAKKNPLFQFMKRLAEITETVTLASHSDALNIVTNLNLDVVKTREGILTMQGDDSEALIDLGLLHGLLIQQKLVEGEPHCELSLVNSHGQAFASLSLLESTFRRAWDSSLNSPGSATRIGNHTNLSL